MIDSGTEPGESYWKSLFEYYTSPEYVQTPPTDDGGSDNTPEVEQIRPNKQMPASSVRSIPEPTVWLRLIWKKLSKPPIAIFQL